MSSHEHELPPDPDEGLPPDLADSRLGALAGAVVRHWDEVLAALRTEERAALTELLADPAARLPVETVLQLEDLLAEAELPPDHAVLAALRGRVRRAGVADPDLVRMDSAVRWLERAVRRTPPASLEAVLARLAGLAAYTADEVLASGADPERAGLIRLRHSETGEIRLPRFQFAAGAPRRAVLEVNRLLGAERDPWGVTSWWVEHHAWLECAPVDLLDGGDERHRQLVTAAEAEVAV